jgi:hypothetical protein
LTCVNARPHSVNKSRGHQEMIEYERHVSLIRMKMQSSVDSQNFFDFSLWIKKDLGKHWSKRSLAQLLEICSSWKSNKNSSKSRLSRTWISWRVHSYS